MAANTRNALKELGAQSMDEAALVEAGKRTIRDEIRSLLRSKGIEDAVGFEVKLTNGATETIVSDSNPTLDRPATEMASATVKQSARAGAFDVAITLTITRV